MTNPIVFPGGPERSPTLRSGDPLLSVESLSKSFLGTPALQDVDFDLRGGEIHALVGENGAGKSTLIKILAGVYASDTGQIYWQGAVQEPVHTPLPLAFIHQDLGMAENMTVAENLALVCGYPRRGPVIDWRGLRQRAAGWLSEVSNDIDPDALMLTLRPAERAMVAIARALARSAQAIVLDEPTSTLARPDAARLFAILKGLRDRGVSSLYVTHRLDEVFEIADRVTVLRDGRVVATLNAADTTADALIEAIIGRPLGELYSKIDHVPAEPLLRLDGVRTARVGPIDLEVGRGEIVGLAGLRGAGQEEVGRLVYGDGELVAGRISIEGVDTTGRKPWLLQRSGVGFVSSRRSEEMLFEELTVRENLIPHVPSHRRGRRWEPRPIRPKREQAQALRILTQFDIRPRDTERPVSTLSGGNQQKTCLARWLGAADGPRLLVLEEPTAGVDIGAKASIYRTLATAATGGTAIVICSSDFDEIAGICNRAYVMRDGQVVAHASDEAMTRDSLLALATGAGTERRTDGD
jgi:ribose transport system ATP-binding protein